VSDKRRRSNNSRNVRPAGARFRQQGFPRLPVRQRGSRRLGAGHQPVKKIAIAFKKAPPSGSANLLLQLGVADAEGLFKRKERVIESAAYP